MHRLGGHAALVLGEASAHIATQSGARRCSRKQGEHGHEARAPGRTRIERPLALDERDEFSPGAAKGRGSSRPWRLNATSGSETLRTPSGANAAADMFKNSV